MRHKAIFKCLSFSRQGALASAFKGKDLMPQFLKVYASVLMPLFKNKQNRSESLPEFEFDKGCEIF